MNPKQLFFIEHTSGFMSLDADVHRDQAERKLVGMCARGCRIVTYKLATRKKRKQSRRARKP